MSQEHIDVTFSPEEMAFLDAYAQKTGQTTAQAIAGMAEVIHAQAVGYLLVKGKSSQIPLLAYYQFCLQEKRPSVAFVQEQGKLVLDLSPVQKLFQEEIIQQLEQLFAPYQHVRLLESKPEQRIYQIDMDLIEFEFLEESGMYTWVPGLLKKCLKVLSQ